LFLASPFIASTITMAGALGNLALSIGVVIGKIAMLSGAVVIGAIKSLLALQVSLVSIGFSAASAWAIALAPIALVIAGIAAVAGAVYFVYQNIEGFKAFFIGAWEGMKQSLVPVAQAFSPISNAVGVVFKAIGSLFGVTEDGAKSWAKWGDAGKVAGEVIGGVIKALLTPFAALLDVVKLVIASINFLSGGEFNFESSVKTLLKNNTEQSIAPLAQSAFNGGLAKQDIGGRLDVRIKSDGQPVIERMQSNNANFSIDAMAGNMVGA
jgi:hypothetical protein